MGPEIGRVIPSGGGDTRNPVLRGNLALVNGHLGQVAGIFIPFKRMSDHGRDVNLTPKVTGEIAKVSALLDDGASARLMSEPRICVDSCGIPTSWTCPTNLA